MNFCVEFQPGPPYSLGQLGQSQPWLGELLLPLQQPLLGDVAGAAAPALLGHFRRHVGRDPVAHFLLEGEFLVVEAPDASIFTPHSVVDSDAREDPLDCASMRSVSDGPKGPNITFDMIPRCTSDEPP